MKSVHIENGASKALSLFVIQLEGEFDLAERERLADAFAVVNSAPIVVVNLERTTYIDSSVLQGLVALLVATQRRGARLILTGVNGSVRRLLEITELRKLFEIRKALSDVEGFDGQVRRLTIEARPSVG